MQVTVNIPGQYAEAFAREQYILALEEVTAEERTPRKADIEDMTIAVGGPVTLATLLKSGVIMVRVCA